MTLSPSGVRHGREPTLLEDTLMLGDIGALLCRGARKPLEPEDLPPPSA